MLDYRRMLMEDFSLSPEIILSCRGEIEHHCSGLHRKGRTLHCLMKVVRGEKGNVGLNCQQAVGCFSVTSLLGYSVGRSTDLCVNVFSCDGDSSEGSLALPDASECWRQLSNCYGMKCNFSYSTLVMFFFFLKKYGFRLFCSGFCTRSPVVLLQQLSSHGILSWVQDTGKLAFL